MSGDWSPSAAREAVRARLCALLISKVDDDVVAKLRKMLKEDRAFDSSEAFKEATRKFL